MRLPLVLAVILAGAVPTATLAGDRYGNAEIAPHPSLLSRALGWTNKQAPADPEGEPVVFAQPAPMALANQYLRGRAPAPGGRLRPSPSDGSQLAYAPVYPAFVPQEPYRQGPSRPAPPLAPAADPVQPDPPEPASPVLAGGLPAYAPPAPAAIAPPQHLADAGGASHGGGEGARLYSVHRAYGLTPDAITAPAQGQGYVLIGPSGGGVAQAPSDEPAAKDDADGDSGEKRDRPF
ncbi:hypothetical protein [Phenylobacterium aquaticum]|uniref:hypothetical protein n=1 Tax=Phenylobacterium aquaticum TaxID=1763816 RepID=UPI0026F1637B|nr:hypothetical protein [Phenylobacterium aquaticum]